MRIGIDCSAAAWQGAGIGRYSRALLTELLQLDRENRYILVYPRGSPRRPAPYLEHLHQLRQEHGNVRLRPIPLSDHWTAVLWQRLRMPLPIEAICGPLDVFYSPDFVLPPQIAGRRVLTVHDLAYLIYPDCAVPALNWYLHGAVPRAIARAHLILADSECTRRDIARFMQVDPARIKVLYSGVEAAFRPIEDQAALDEARARYDLPDRFLLTVGTVEPRKNLPRLFEALAALPETLRLPLVVAGKPGWRYDGIFAAVREWGLQDEVRFIGFVPEEDLPALYNLALALAYPSLYEGFGLPPLEAMACGTPVLTSRAASIPEVVGEAAILVHPAAANSIADGLRALLEDSELRARLRQAGLARARQFTWEAAARQLLVALGLREEEAP